jgi:uncharacterized membrane protein YphA (DoxX/SURF4 family)
MIWPTIRHSWLLFMRVTIPCMLIIQMLSFYKDYPLFFSEAGLIQPDIMHAALTQKGLMLYDVQQWMAAKGYTLDHYHLAMWTMGAHLFFLVCLALGFLTRLSAILCLALHLLITQTMHHFLYGGDFFYTILLFYCTLAPLSRYYSVDNWLRRGRTSRLEAWLESLLPARTLLRVMQAHLCIAYFFSGFEKMLGFNWRNGESVWKSLHNYEGFIPLERLDALAHTPVFMLLGWSVILLELLYPLMVNLRFTRQFWVGGMLLLHLSIIGILGLFHFSVVMIIFNMITYVVPYSASFALKTRASGSQSGANPVLSTAS